MYHKMYLALNVNYNLSKRLMSYQLCRIKINDYFFFVTTIHYYLLRIGFDWKKNNNVYKLN